MALVVGGRRPVELVRPGAAEEQLGQHLDDGLGGIVLFDPYYVLYYAGFAFARMNFSDSSV